MKVLKRKLDKTKTKKSYKKVVWFYNFWSWLTESKAAKKVIDLAEIEDRKSVLEVACGTGVVFELIVHRNPNGENIGIDLSPDMLSKARKRVKKESGNFELREGDALNLDFNDKTFDILINNFMVDLMPEETFDKIAQEFHRVLKPQGVLAISTFSFGEKRVNKIWLWVAKHFPGLLTGCRPVSFKTNLIKAGFSIEQDIEVSQNTFPSEVLKVIKHK
ncbi:MAG: methyltransferase domain-containing protein [Caldithrix sp.]|nr:methyltransferase domain-containing protein [Caldithrix sp.]